MQDSGLLWEITAGTVAALRRYAWFDCGYKFCVSLRSFWRSSHSSYVVIDSVNGAPASSLQIRILLRTGDFVRKWQHRTFQHPVVTLYMARLSWTRPMRVLLLQHKCGQGLWSWVDAQLRACARCRMDLSHDWNSTFVGNTGHFDNEIDLARSGGSTISRRLVDILDTN